MQATTLGIQWHGDGWDILSILFPRLRFCTLSSSPVTRVLKTAGRGEASQRPSSTLGVLV